MKKKDSEKNKRAIGEVNSSSSSAEESENKGTKKAKYKQHQPGQLTLGEDEVPDLSFSPIIKGRVAMTMDEDDEWLAEHCWPHSRDFSKWDMTAMVGNVYNRLVLYRGDLFHSSLDYFGNDKHDGRLFQTFFFNTEY